ncbi:MBL fold metallo-hydrolase RNA specificity domain-containing protein [Streptomyces dysideae]|nr:hypothetical protein [Streptomyces dysideae]
MNLPGFSAHANAGEIIDNREMATPLHHVTHLMRGEPDAGQALPDRIDD